MDSKATSVVGYISIVGWILAYAFGDREGAKFHLNQGLILGIFGLLTFIPYFGYLIPVLHIVFLVMGIINAVNDEEKELPIIGQFQLLK